ncbi:M1 family metallopeptidase [Pedobacter sp. R20-19]|uniref:M1 family metallopeptidase n=1 Tax=Pedobacter sp. R20-19 TaxID=1270196 RepID=UPI00049369D4|nr:M1 family metallopeptidase [Pedobacter sp. R20-19]
MKIIVFFFLLFLTIPSWFHAQTSPYIVNINKEQVPINTSGERNWWNLLHYTIAITPDFNKKFISGTNEITFIAYQRSSTLQIDLQDPMRITSITWENVNLPYIKQKEKYFITFPREVKKGETHAIFIKFEGYPTEAINPPFDNGWIWAKDKNGRPWISIACEGSGASIWLPCKDILYDEPDNGVAFSITVPDTLTAVSNGRLQNKVVNKGGTATYNWKVINPINNYNIIPYIGKYTSWHSDYKGLKGLLDCNFWVLDYNLARAKRHLLQTDTMLRAFEYWMGAYPFYKDGYKLVEAPMPGMEHQSGIAYGNGFQNGYKGRDAISGSGWGLKWDFILVHESGHEWFGNSLSSSSNDDSWIHEGFAKYLESLYTAYVWGNEAGNEYSLGTWKHIKNDQPILGSSTSDKYYKGAAMLHTIRQVLGDTVFRGWLHGLNQTFYHQTISTKQILRFLNYYTKKDFTSVFAQYLESTQVPAWEYNFYNGKLYFRWTNCKKDFDMPLNIAVDGKTFQLVYPTTQWQTLFTFNDDIKRLLVDKNYYVKVVKRQSQVD